MKEKVTLSEKMRLLRLKKDNIDDDISEKEITQDMVGNYFGNVFIDEFYKLDSVSNELLDYIGILEGHLRFILNRTEDNDIVWEQYLEDAYNEIQKIFYEETEEVELPDFEDEDDFENEDEEEEDKDNDFDLDDIETEYEEDIEDEIEENEFGGGACWSCDD